MGLNYVVKVQYGGTLRRLELKEDELDFSQLEIRTRDLLQIAPTTQLAFTYTDRDGDNITMGDDQDIQDALVLQSLNPLDVSVQIVGTNTIAPVIQGQSFNSSIGPAKQEEELTTEKDNAGGMATVAKNAENRSTVNTEDAADASKLSPIAVDSKTPRKSDAASSDDKCGRPIHYGISCDICGTSPLKGPRFKSMIKFDYDLCESCFKTHDCSPGEYIKIDRTFNRLHHPLRRGRTIQLRRPAALSHRCGPFGIPYPNCGATSYGFHHFDVDEPHEIRPVVVVNGHFMSPCCRSPHPRFGHYVWMPGEEKTPLGTEDKATKTEEEKKTEKVHSRSCERVKSGNCTNVAMKRGENVEHIKKEAATEAAVDRIPNSSTPYNPVAHGGVNEARSSSKHETQHDLPRQEGLLAKLAAMGFTDHEMNSDMLEKNKLDLRKTVDDLLAAEEWDSILDDLQELGFHDRSMNRRLLLKYDGNVKPVVKELVKASNSVH